MTSPFDIEEIFPDDGGRPVRLPRRQAGNSPQGLAVTLLADYTLRTRAWLPSAAIVALLAESGVSHAGARTAISRLARRGVLEGSRQGRRSSYRLSRGRRRPPLGRRQLDRRLHRPRAGRGTAGGRWSPSPCRRSAARSGGRCAASCGGWATRRCTTGCGSPRTTSPRKAQAQLAQLTLGAVTVFRARHVELDAATGRDPLDAWDIEAIAGQYESFLRRWSPLLPRIRAGQVGGAEAVRARTEVMDTYRRFPVLDPQLPARAAARRAGCGSRPRELFAAVYDGLAEAAEDARTGGRRRASPTAASPASTRTPLADLLAGVRPTSSAERIARPSVPG